MRVLVVDDDSDEVNRLSRVMAGWGHQVVTAQDGAEALTRLSSFTPEIIVTDLRMPRMDGFELMTRLKSAGTLPPTIVLTGFGSVDIAIQAVHDYGAFWFLEKPVDLTSLRALMMRASDQSRLSAENNRLRHELAQRGVLGDLVGQSAVMQSMFALIRQVAPTTAGVLITGQSGSGKELVARAIHSLSQRSSEPFLAINCAALPEALIESELFGHEKGAFTGAIERRAGALELAQGGTLFLDEIGEMPVAMQSKLLRVLEDFRFRRLGGKVELKADVRLISATNRVPSIAIREGTLREDLYYRLNIFEIHVPPLRDRLEDIAPISAAMIEKLNRKHGTRVTHLDPAALEALTSLKWNGNVRELRNVIERAVIIAGEGALSPRHLSLSTDTTAVTENTAKSGLAIRVGMSADEAERVLIQATLDTTNGNQKRAALILGICDKTMRSKLRQYESRVPVDAVEQKARTTSA